ncbi:MAG: D-alanine--D-alanine ligase [Gemmatimonadetes bacterium]|uniref:D-alanine--D-alanine ligase n=1 Tax=Candidatus Kutchimonas denitrificans TaxID=3056748 RepID=A0AAE5CDB6_9BACT|nr:D-alanine--D-alanine ligase [Gemmatimonadota bacterium]NIR75464.1 D-alanine--D-alanine ligase [Candidatus Kutchimonas denitrificans]NIS01778.1 D-alanine--D-alanine ligase [Gemmatimonadota bacterium]NIT67559.1 D-alanine--D-alanine ligase [Gemmatimonadota bacterium]NIU53433.1 D-alanine--D-alanine ligase [Gemmatimonadota bacterium]
MVVVDEIAEKEAAATGMAAPSQSTVRIIEALRQLGYETVELALQEHRIHEWVKRLASDRFDFAFNLCETVAGHAEGEHLAAATMELLKLPKTGASAATLLYCLDKDRCAAVLRSHGIPVPDWALVYTQDAPPADWNQFPAIVKPAADDASNGVHPGSVVESAGELAGALERIRPHWKRAVVQQFIEGREINLAIVGNHLLPPAEIDFSRLPDDSPPIVSFEAKWMTGSPEDLGTQPICPAPLSDNEARRLQLLAGRAWALMEGRGYARVDIRIAADGAPYVIDINPNPDLSVDAGLARQARVAGWSFTDLIHRIVDSALATNGKATAEREWVFLRPVEKLGDAR